MIDFNNRIHNLIETRPIPLEKIMENIILLTNNKTSENLKIVLELAKMDDIYDHDISDPAFFAILSWGEDGINAIAEELIYGKLNIFGRTIIALLNIATGTKFNEEHFLAMNKEWLENCSFEIDETLSNYAKIALREIIFKAKSDPDLAFNLFYLLGSQVNFLDSSTANADRRNLLVKLIFESNLTINSNILKDFSSLLESSPEREEELHSFLFSNPILIDPLANEIRSKHELGDDFITDFIIRRLDDKYTLVEIERSNKRLFINNGNFSTDLTHSIRQVLDFQTWVGDHLEYANSKLPGINRPEGLIVIGRKRTLDTNMKRRLDEENFSRRGHIKIVTYDDLLESGRTLYNNIINRPILFKGKKRI